MIRQNQFLVPSIATLVLVAATALGSECRVEPGGSKTSRPVPWRGENPDARARQDPPSGNLKVESKNPCLDGASRAPAKGYSQSELDEMDCLCEKGHGRCCAILGQSLDRVKNLGFVESRKPIERYMELACRHGSGVGCVTVAPDIVGVDREKIMQAISLTIKQCLKGDEMACYHSRFGGKGIPGDLRMDRRMKQWRCARGCTYACRDLAQDASRVEEALVFHDHSCRIAVSDGDREELCAASAFQRYQAAYPEVYFGHIKDQPDLPVFAFHELVMSCSVRFGGIMPFECNGVAALCSNKEFQHPSKEKWCPRVLEMQRRYLAAERAAKMAGVASSWPPDRPYAGKNLEMPSCERWKARGAKRGKP